MNEYAPICLFTFNRLEKTINTIEHLKKNYLAEYSDLFIFSDGPKNDTKNIKQVESVRNYLLSVSGFKSVTIYESNINLGLANSIISGVNLVIKKFGKIIVLEDDLITSPFFLTFMNGALDYYKYNTQVGTICGFSHDLRSVDNLINNIYFGIRPSSWGWATWERDWIGVKWENKEYIKYLINPYYWYKMLKGGSDIPYMLYNQLTGRIDSWAIRWTVTNIVKNKYSVFPINSFIENVGIDKDATNTKKSNRFTSKMFNKNSLELNFTNDINLNSNVIREFNSKYSILARLKDKFI